MLRRLLPFLVLLAACTATSPRQPLRNDDPDLAAEYHASKRTGSDDVHRSLAVARDAMMRMQRYTTVGDTVLPPKRSLREPVSENEPRHTGRWEFLGPGNVGGRTRVIVFDPADPEIMYAAGVSGGIWKTRSAGELWEPIADELANITVNSLAIDPSDRNTLYAGTGEGYFREDQRGTALPLRGNGVFVSHDAGLTWTRLASTAGEDFHWVNDLVVSAHDPARLYAATRTGVWRSNDRGASWSRVLATTVHGGCLDLAWRGDTTGDFLFASCGTFEQATIYRHENAERATAWTPVLTDEFMGRTTLAIAPSDPSVIYALSASNRPGPATYQGLHAVWRSSQSGAPGSWTKQMAHDSPDMVGRNMLTNFLTIDNDICGGVDEAPLTMGWYCNTIAVDPADANRVWVGGVDLFRSDDGGLSWGQASYWWTEFSPIRAPFVHADQHVIAFHPQYDGNTNRIAYFGNDGGVFKTTNARAKVVYGKDAVCVDDIAAVPFVSLNNSFGVTQFYHGAVFPDGRSFIGGTQDNGTILGSLVDGPNQWRRVHGGDGGYVAVNQRYPDVVFAESQNGNIVSSRDGGRSFLSFRQKDLEDSFLFITPFTLDPNADNTIWIGGTALWRNSDFGRWTRASAPVPGRVSAIAVAPGMSNRVIAGTSQGSIVRTDAATTATGDTAWASTRPRTGFVTSLTYDPVDPNVVYATYAQFGGVHVWKSTDAGATWLALDGSGDAKLPDIPVHSLAVDPTRRERLYLGTDLGIFVSLDGGQTWAVENSGFPNVVTEAVVIGQGTLGPAVYAFTHGRGAWRAELTKVGPRRRAVGK